MFDKLYCFVKWIVYWWWLILVRLFEVLCELVNILLIWFRLMLSVVVLWGLKVICNFFGCLLVKLMWVILGICVKWGLINLLICFWNCVMFKLRLLLLKFFGVISNVVVVFLLLLLVKIIGLNVFNGRGGVWLRLVNILSIVCCMFCLIVKVNVIELLLWLM